MVWTNRHECTHIHQTKTVTTMSRLPARGLDKNLDLLPSNMVLFPDTLSCHDDQFAKLFSNPIMHDKVIGQTEANAQSLSADCDLDL